MSTSPNWKRFTVMNAHTYAGQMPPLRPSVVGGKIAVSCEKPKVFLIRAWSPTYYSGGRLIDWILHHIGRLDTKDLIWWGYTYRGQPTYMTGNTNQSVFGSGLTIQHFIEPRDKWTRDAQDEGRLGLVYGEPRPLPIPDKGIFRNDC